MTHEAAALETPVPLAIHPSVPVSEPRPAVMPIVMMASLLVHGLAFVAAALLPPPAAAIAMQTDFEIELLAPEPEPVLEVEQPPPPPEPEPEPEPAAILEPPRPRPPREQPAEPPPPAPVMVAEAAGSSESDFAMPPGEEGGTLDGQPGGTGQGPVEADPAPAPAPEPERTGLSRRELRARLLGYIRSTLSAYVNQNLDYPLAARRASSEGVVVLRLRLAHDGRILSVRLSSTSGHEILDRAALARVSGLGSMPAPPSDIPWDDSLELPLPVTYQLR